jgi:hypothetical protein
MTVSERWTEVLRCPACASTAVATLSQPRLGQLVVEKLPPEFKAVSSEYGDTFYCSACDRAARTQVN